MKTIRLTMAQAVVRYLANQRSMRDGKQVPLFAGVWAIFGHGNVAGIGEALYHAQDTLPTFRAHNEQAMAHSAIAFAKAARRRQMMACTTSIGPGATNMVTAAAVAHVDRLPVLLLPGDIFANRRPDPVLQQVEDFGDGTVSANDCFKPVSRYFDRIMRPEQILTALPRAMQVLTDPAECGPVTLCMCQDVQAEAYDYPEAFFEEHVWGQRRIEPDRDELAHAVSHLKRAKKPFIVSGGGVLYSEAEKALADFAEKRGIPVAETQAGKSALSIQHKQNMGSIGVTGSSAANALAQEADLVLAIGTRLQDFTTGSRALFRNPERKIINLNIQVFDAGKHGGIPLVTDARAGIAAVDKALGDWSAPGAWQKQAAAVRKTWTAEHAAATAAPNRGLPSDGAGDRRGAARGQAERHRGGRVRRPAGRTAQAVAVRRAGRLSPGIRLFLHGLRDRRRHRRQDGRSRARGRRHGRRRLVPHDELGDRDLGHDGPEADHRAAGQSRLRLHQPAAARDRRRELQQPAAARQARDPAGDRLRGACQEHGREGGEGVEHSGAGSRDGRARARRTAPASS